MVLLSNLMSKILVIPTWRGDAVGASAATCCPFVVSRCVTCRPATPAAAGRHPLATFRYRSHSYGFVANNPEKLDGEKINRDLMKLVGMDQQVSKRAAIGAGTQLYDGRSK